MPTVLAQPVQGTLVDKIIAHVDNQIILQSELEAAYEQYLLQGGEKVSDLKCRILESLVLNKLLLAKAQQEKVIVSNEEIDHGLNSRIQYLVSQLGSTAAIEKYWGKSIREIKQKFREKIKEQLRIDKMRSQVIRKVSVTPQEVKAFFESLPSNEHPYYSAEVEVRQIVRYPRVSPQEEDALMEQLKALKARIKNGESFETLAQTYSQDPGSAPQGGELGFWRLGELAPPYEKAALALQPGQVSEPVATPFGLHLIQLIAREKDRYNSRHILLRPPPASLDIEGAK
ncbi:MAG: peptidylprolyl isomerase, partial [Bacteroidota bacterium]